MFANQRQIPPQRIAVLMPTWLGDCVMATPLLRALRQRFPEAHITALIGSGVKQILEPCPWIDELIAVDSKKHHSLSGLFAISKKLKKQGCDLAVLLPNSFRSALIARLAGVPRRIGYDRDSRGALLTDRLAPYRSGGKYVTVPAVDYYLGLGGYLGADIQNRKMTLHTNAQQDNEAKNILNGAGFNQASGKKLILLCPGGSFGSAKLWFPKQFAAVGDQCASQLGAVVAVTGAPEEREILDQVCAAARTPVIDLPKAGMRLEHLKSILRQADLLITNDTGPRHVAAALGTPVVTIFGPTDPAWTVIDFDKEKQVNVHVFCSPCQKKQCPLTGTENELICMKQITVDMVFDAAMQLI